jgi:hypothetical protein
VVSDEPLRLPDDPHFVNLVTGAGAMTSPATKRDLARASIADADVYAYLDDDAYPAPDWLDNAALVLSENARAAGAGGPGLAPDDQTFWERVSVAIMEMPAGSGPLRFRFVRELARDCDDFPAYDLFVRASWLEHVGGWATAWYGGEDTALCTRLADMGGLIRYDPRLAVFHYRRKLIPDHMWQVYNVGRSRGCFIRSGDRRSHTLVFAAPALFMFGVIAAALSPLMGVPIVLVAGLFGAGYAGIAVFGHAAPLDWRVRVVAPFALLAHHGAYALGLLYGLATGSRTVRVA